MSYKRGILFSENKDGRFSGVHRGRFGAFSGVLCPKNGAPCFQKKTFGVFRGCPFLRHVLKTGYLVFGKQGWPFFGVSTLNRHHHFHIHQTVATNCGRCCFGFYTTGPLHVRWPGPPLGTERISWTISHLFLKTIEWLQSCEGYP